MIPFESLMHLSLLFRHDSLWYSPIYGFAHCFRNQVDLVFQPVTKVVYIDWCCEQPGVLRDILIYTCYGTLEPMVLSPGSPRSGNSY